MTASGRYFSSSSFKMALLFTVLLGLCAALIVYSLYDSGRQDFLRETEAAIDAEISMFSAVKADSSTPEAPARYIRQRVSRSPDVYLRLEDAQGAVLAGNISALPSEIYRMAEGMVRFTLQEGPKQHELAAKFHTFPDDTRVMAARDIRDLLAGYERLKTLSVVIMTFMLAVVLVSIGVSYFVVSRINRIAGTADDIIRTGDLSRRIAIDTRWDDLSKLGSALNRFLERIQTLMTGVREVSNNIAHDLRTPLTSLRGDIEALKEGPIDERRLDALLAEIDGVLAIFHSLLRIANIKQGERYSAFTRVDMRALLTDVTDLYEPVAEEKSVRLEFVAPDEVSVKGDRDLLFQLFANLLDNAVKFSPEGATVRLTVSSLPGAARITLQDAGPGIPAHEKEKVFRHFYRGDGSRSSPGNGLGLSLAKAVIEQHQGAVTLTDAQPGLIVTVTLPPYQ